MNKIFALFLALICSFARADESTASLTSSTFNAMSITATPITNPDRGWAVWAGSDILNSFSTPSGNSLNSRLASCLVNLSAFRAAPIDQTTLNLLETRLNSIRSAGYKCVMWFFYEFSGSANDATATQIVAHLAQLKPIFRDHADIIPFFKAGFIGSYGEWWSSNNNNSCNSGDFGGGTTCETARANRLLVRNALLDAVHPETEVVFRYPADVWWWNNTALSANQAFSGSRQARSGHHNDCMLSSNNDTGTWGINHAGGSSSLGAEGERNYTQQVTQYIPFGGELSSSCATPHLTTCSEALTYFARFNLVWLKDASNITAWRNGWSSGGCTNEIYNRMGYRLQLSSISHQSAAARGQTVTFTVAMRNVGWGRVQGSRRLEIVLTNGSNTISCQSAAQLRQLPQDATVDSSIAVPSCLIPSNAATGTWNVHIRFPDKWGLTGSSFYIRPANTDSPGTWDGTNSRFTTSTTISVS